ncbi:Zinc-binding dehydrogenase [Rhizoctonia solani]|uniref:alcohol dehydrogenase n=1 Tax=Rhizoctonia solani TaxID=456999 RepID=A0A8H8P1J2_9AGAM|nr:Zinc-binding dehydrogenase [Rhizoctonia solani]QRW22148.1 Zinc-binding dehydrogenase [Rhizoctonia solani]
MTRTHPTTELTVPQTQKAAIIEKSGDSVKIVEKSVVQASELKPGEVLVKVLYSGVCHTDVHIAEGALGDPPIKPLVGGHEGTGVIVAIGEGTQTPLSIGQAVGINCTPVTFGGSNSLRRDIRALKQSDMEPGDVVVITGAGGGLGHLAVQYAINAFGLRVIAIDTGDNKKELCLKLGAENFIDFKKSGNVADEVKRITDGAGAHAVLVTSSATNGYEGVLDYLRPCGRLLALGATIGCKIDIDVITCISRSITIKGMVIGNRAIAHQALDIAARGRVNTVCRIEPLAKLSEIFEELKSGTLAGRVVLDLWA